MQEPEAQQKSTRRKCTVGPNIGTIKATIGFGRLHLRDQIKVTGEWEPVALTFPIKRLHKLGSGAMLWTA